MLIRFVFLAMALACAGLAANERPPAVSILRVPNGGIQPEVTVGTDGTVHMIYFAGEPKGGDLYYMKVNADGKTFSPALRVNSQQGSAIALGTIRGGQIALGRNGRVHVAWNGSNSALPKGPMNPDDGKPGNPMLYARLDDQGTAFEPQRNLMHHTFGLDGGGTLTADAAGNVYVAWHGKAPGAAAGEAGRQVWLAQSHDDGKNFVAETPVWKQTTGACGCCGMAMAATRDGSLYALYRSAAENVHRDIYILVSKDRGKTFQGAMVDPWEIGACPMSSMAVIESAGTTLAAWETRGQALFGTVSGTSVIKPVAATSEGKGRKHPRLARNSRGETILVWTEGTGWQRGGSLAWQVFDGAGKALGEKGTMPGLPAWSFAAVAARPDGSFTIYY